MPAISFIMLDIWTLTLNLIGPGSCFLRTSERGTTGYLRISERGTTDCDQAGNVTAIANARAVVIRAYVMSHAPLVMNLSATRLGQAMRRIRTTVVANSCRSCT